MNCGHEKINLLSQCNSFWTQYINTWHTLLKKNHHVTVAALWSLGIHWNHQFYVWAGIWGHFSLNITRNISYITFFFRKITDFTFNISMWIWNCMRIFSQTQRCGCFVLSSICYNAQNKLLDLDSFRTVTWDTETNSGEMQHFFVATLNGTQKRDCTIC